MNAEQNGQRQAAETELQEIEEAISLEEDDSKKAGLQEELSKKQTELKDMLDGFEVLIPHSKQLYILSAAVDSCVCFYNLSDCLITFAEASNCKGQEWRGREAI